MRRHFVGKFSREFFFLSVPRLLHGAISDLARASLNHDLAAVYDIQSGLLHGVHLAALEVVDGVRTMNR